MVFFVSAEDFGAGETVQFYLVDSFSANDVKLYYNYTELVNINPIVREINNINLLYFDLPINCSLGTYYLDYSTGNLTFDVVESMNVMRVSPVYFLFDKTKSSFYIELTSVKGDFDVLVNATNAQPRKSFISLSEGETKKLYVDYSDVSNDGNVILDYDNFSYEIRLFSLEVDEEENVTEVIIVVDDEVPIVEKIPLTFLVTNPNASIALNHNQSVAATLKVQNTFGEKIDGLGYSVTGNLAGIVSFKSEVVSLEDGEILETEFIFNSDESALVGSYYGEIVFGNENYIVSLPVNVVISEEELSSDDALPDVFPPPLVLEEEESGNGILIMGIVLILLMVIFIAVVLIKLRQKPEKRFNEYIEETKKKK